VFFCFQVKCSVDDLGYPFATNVKWHHNGREIAGRHSFVLTIREADVAAAGLILTFYFQIEMNNE
jgi:hypothetical protein